MYKEEEEVQLFENVRTGEKIQRGAVQDNEIVYDGKMLIVETDTDGIITYANRSTREILDYTKEELEGVPFIISIHPDMPEGICKEAFKVANEGNVWSGYVQSITKNGEFFWTTTCVQAKFGMDKNIQGYIIRKKFAEDQIIEMVKEEYAQLKDMKVGEYSSEYCRALQFKNY